jgi:hypothetical protein
MTKHEPVPVAGPLRNAAGPLMRQIRKYDALATCLELLPRELEGLAAPCDIRLAAREEDSGLRRNNVVQKPPAADTAGEGQPLLSTLFILTASPTVASIVSQRSRELIAAINARLAYPLVEAIRCENASPQKIERQMNILRLEPD